MRSRCLIFLIGSFFFSYLYAEDKILLDDFTSSQKNVFPAKWKAAKDRGEKFYLIQEEKQNCFLRAVSKDDSVNIAIDVKWDLKAYNYLNWKWRVNEHPQGTDQKIANKHDSACAVYVLIKNRFSVLPKYIKYVFSENLSKEERFFYKKNRAIVILRGKEAETKKWYFESRNVMDDYNFFYGKKISKIVGVSLLTDSNDTETEASGDYDDLIISKKPLYGTES